MRSRIRGHGHPARPPAAARIASARTSSWRSGRCARRAPRRAARPAMPSAIKGPFAASGGAGATLGSGRRL